MSQLPKLKIVYIGYGALGRLIVEDLRRWGRVDIAAIIDPAVPDALDGTGDFHRWDEVDCVVATTQSDLSDCAPLFRDLLSRGQSVVSTCEELTWPWLRHPSLSDELHALALAHGGRLLGTGVNPGFLMDSFPVAAARAARRVDRVTVYRIQDATSRRLPFRQKIGAGLSDVAFSAKVADGSLRHVGLGESMHFMAHYLGLPIDDWHESLGPVRGPDGGITGVRQEAHGTQAGRVRVELVFQAAIGQDDPHDRLVLQGDPDLDVTWRGGVHGDVATSAMVQNSIHPLLAAKPGLHTMASIPLSGLQR